MCFPGRVPTAVSTGPTTKRWLRHIEQTTLLNSVFRLEYQVHGCWPSPRVAPQAAPGRPKESRCQGPPILTISAAAATGLLRGGGGPPAAKGGQGSLGLEVVGSPVGASAAGFGQAESADSGRGGGGAARRWLQRVGKDEGRAQSGSAGWPAGHLRPDLLRLELWPDAASRRCAVARVVALAYGGPPS
jgi:hypothetical protein